MMLLTQAQHAQLLDNGRRQAAVKGTPDEIDFPPVVKLFNPCGAATWLLTEIDPDDETVAWGLCDLGMGCPEFGTVSLAELAECAATSVSASNAIATSPRKGRSRPISRRRARSLRISPRTKSAGKSYRGPPTRASFFLPKNASHFTPPNPRTRYAAEMIGHAHLRARNGRAPMARVVTRPSAAPRTVARAGNVRERTFQLPGRPSSDGGFQPDPYADYGRFLTPEGGILIVYKDLDLRLHHTLWRVSAWTAFTGLKAGHPPFAGTQPVARSRCPDHRCHRQLADRPKADRDLLPDRNQARLPDYRGSRYFLATLYGKRLARFLRRRRRQSGSMRCLWHAMGRLSDRAPLR